MALRVFLLCGAAALLTLVAVEAPRRILAPDVGFQEGTAAGVVFLVASLLASWLTYRADVQGAGLAASVTRGLVHGIERKYGKLHPMARQRFSTGALKAYLSSDVQNVAQAISQVVTNGVPALALSLACIPFIAWQLGWLGVFGIALLFSQLVLAHALSLGIGKLEGTGKKSFDALLGIAGEWLRNMRLVRSLGWSDAVEDRMAKHMRAYVHAGAKSHILLCLIFGTSFSWWMVPLAGMLLAAVATRSDPDITALFQATWLLSALSKYTMHLPNTLTRWTQARVSLQRMAPFLAAPETLSAASGPCRIGEPVAVEFEAACLEIDGRTVLCLNNLRIPLGRKTVVVGPVGAGKSLFLGLLLGRIPPTSGKVSLVDARGAKAPLDEEGARVALHALCALVEQEPFLSSDTLAFNVSLEDTPQGVDGNAGEAGILMSLQRAEFAADLATFPGGLRTMVGEAGVTLSGGQRQRVNLARALDARRPFWVLDDPLSAVDARTEERLVTTLAAHDGGFVLVTHRLTGAALFEHVIVLEGGRVVEEGPPAELLARSDSRFLAMREVLR